MASNKASIASTRPRTAHKYSTDRYQRQAGLSLRIEEGRQRGPPKPAEARAVNTLFEKYDLKPREESEDLPTSLTRADTFHGSPFEEYHPGNRVIGPRRLTLQDVKGSFIKPFEEPNPGQQASIDQRIASSATTKVESFDPEYAQSQIQRLASDAKNEKSYLRRLSHKLRGRRAIKPGAFSGLAFVASLPTAHANAVLAHARDPLEERRMIYVLEYSQEANNAITCAPPFPFESVESLRQYLEEPTDSAIRLIYACNHNEALNFLSSQYGISSASREVGERSFREWMQGERDSRRANNKAVRWRPAFDVARKLTATAFAIDFGAVIFPDENGELPTDRSKSYLYESTHRQRLAVYMQRPTENKNHFPRATRFTTGSKSLPPYAKLPTIIVCESSAGGVGEVVSIGPLLGLDIPSRSSDPPSEAVNNAFESILSRVTEDILRLWEQQITLLHEPHAELEDAIWSRPADSSRAREVWSMSQRLHTILKHVNRHEKVLEAIEDDFQVFSEREEEQEWLDHTLDEFEHLAETIRVDYLEPLEHMIDLVSMILQLFSQASILTLLQMYKSVAIRDARQSLELNASLWRLSWITFVFLPLTFLSGFFGMNVHLFGSDPLPSIRWYFVAAVALLLLVIGFWFTFKTFGPGGDLTQEEYSKEELKEAGVHVRKEKIR